MIGVLGGMGPLATADFFSKVIALAGVDRDEDHVPLLIQSDPRIPSRPAAILEGGPSPLPALLAGRDRLLAAGARALAMPCNTAHHWSGPLASGCPVPFLSIVETACDAAAHAAPAGGEVLVLGTRATLAARLFDAPLAARGLSARAPDEDALARAVLPAIAAVKAGRAGEGGRLLAPSIARAWQEGHGCVMLACTELPIALQAIGALDPRCIDTTAELARACVRWWRDVGARETPAG